MPEPRDHSELHALAQFLAVRSECDGIVLLTKDYKSAIANYPASAMILLLQTPKTLLPEEEVSKLPDNVVTIPLKQAGRSLMRNKVFVCVDYLENEKSRFRFYGHKPITSISKRAMLSIWSVKSGAGWDANKLKALLHYNKTALAGSYKNKDLVVVNGRLTDVFSQRYPTLPVLAVVSEFNEVDIIEPVINHLLDQGVDVHVIDNWSDDGSYEAVEELARKNPKRVSLERFPAENTGKYEWTKILTRVTKLAKERPQYKWIISNDADEIRWSPWPGVSLQKAISFIDHKGFNIIDYTVFNFSPTKDGYQRGMNPEDFFRYGDFGHEGWHFMQLKTWRNDPKAEIAESGGHLVEIDEPKIFPLKFLINHYPLRSNEQAAKKIFRDRKPRFHANERKKGWHSHYDKISSRQNFIVNSQGLLDFSQAKRFYQENLIELTSGIGIKVNTIKKTK